VPGHRQAGLAAADHDGVQDFVTWSVSGHCLFFPHVHSAAGCRATVKLNIMPLCMCSALHSGDPAYDDLPQQLLDRLEPALQTLLARAVDGGYARDDVTAREVLMTIALICQPVRGQQPSFNQRMTRVFMDGLCRCRVY
jgi:hypothetical protein